MSLTGTVTLDAQNDHSAVFIFQAGSPLITASSSTVKLTGGAQACNVFWQVGSSATLGAKTTFVGSILALTDATVQTGASVAGRVLARNGQVSLDDNTITRPTGNTSSTASPSATSATPSATAGTPSSTSAAGGGTPTGVPAGTDGILGVPDNPAEVDWWTGSVPAGSSTGSTVIDGHVDSAVTGEGGLFRLTELALGDRISLTATTGLVVPYRVTGRRVYVKHQGLGTRPCSVSCTDALQTGTCRGGCSGWRTDMGDAADFDIEVHRRGLKCRASSTWLALILLARRATETARHGAEATIDAARCVSSAPRARVHRSRCVTH